MRPGKEHTAETRASISRKNTQSKTVITQLRVAAGLTLEDLRTALGYRSGQCFGIFAGSGAAWPAFQHRVADYFGVPVEVLFDDRGFAK